MSVIIDWPDTVIGGLERFANGDLLVLTLTDVESLYAFWLSTDLGDTWTRITFTEGTNFPDFPSSGAPDVQHVGFFVDNNDAIWMAGRDGGAPGHVARGTLSGTHITFDNGYSFGTTNTQDVLDLTVVQIGGDDFIGLVYADDATTSGDVRWMVVTRTSGGSYSTAENETLLHSNHGVKWVGIDFHHTGDGRTIDTDPHFYVAYQCLDGADLFFRRMAYTSGPDAWATGTEQSIDTTCDSLRGNMFYDGTVIMMTVSDTVTPFYRVWERDEADTTTTERTDGTLAANGASVTALGTYDTDGNYYLHYIDRTGADVVEGAKLTRSGLTWDVALTTLYSPVTTIASGLAITRRPLGSSIFIALDDTDPRPDETVLVRTFSSGATLEIWDGAAWISGTPKVWNGSSWDTAIPKAWNGSAWVP
jgi:hypothetical protein